MASAASATAVCSGLTNNPDISGVGVRISFYLQTFLLVLLVDRSWEDAPNALWTFIATSFGLTVAAIAQDKVQQLSLFQALQVSNLVWLANFGTFVALASYSRKKAASHRDKGKGKGKEKEKPGSDYYVKFGAMMQTLLSMSLTLYMWWTVETFGNQPSCNPLVQYTLFVIKAPAVRSGRTVGLAVSGLLTAIYVVITLHELHSYYTSLQRKKERDAARNEDNQRLPPPATSPRERSATSWSSFQTMPMPVALTPSSHSPPALAVRTRDRANTYSSNATMMLPSPATSSALSQYASRSRKSKKGRPKRRRWFADLDPMLVGIIICQAMVFSYFIVSSELLLGNNPTVDEADAVWGFGQILALILIIPAGLSVVGALKKNGLGRTSTRKRSGSGSRPGKKGRPSILSIP